METTASPPETAPARRRVPARTRLDFWFDAVLLVAYTLAYSLGFTGLAIHEWLGLGIGLALLLHLTLHWDWVVRTTVKLFARGGRDRGIWLLNLALLVVMTLCVLSGVLISRIALYQLGISVSPVCAPSPAASPSPAAPLVTRNQSGSPARNRRNATTRRLYPYQCRHCDGSRLRTV